MTTSYDYIGKYSIIEVNSIWIEDLFEWFYSNVMQAGGDGGGAIVCENYKEAADLFNDWWMKTYQPTNEWTQKQSKFPNPKVVDEERHQVYYGLHDECFIFTDDINMKLFHGEYVFIVREDCVFAYERSPGKLIGIPK